MSSCTKKPAIRAELLCKDALSALRGGEAPDFGKRQYTFTAKDKKRFREDPEYYLQFRKQIEAEINTLFGMYLQDSDIQVKFRDIIEKEMLRRMGPGNEKLKEFIIPTWSVGCRRVSPADGYLEALVSDNVTPVFGEIDRVTEHGVVVKGEERKVDILICATGFQAAFKPAFKVSAASNATLSSLLTVSKGIQWPQNH